MKEGFKIKFKSLSNHFIILLIFFVGAFASIDEFLSFRNLFEL